MPGTLFDNSIKIQEVYMQFGKRMSACAIIILAVFFGAAGARAQEALEPQWLWGEVETINAQAKTLQVKYLDYDTDLEKELTISVDEKTKFENVKGLEEIKPQDTISVDYVVGSNGANLALDISVEKLEDMEEAPVDLQEPVVEKERVGAAPASGAVEPPAAQAASPDNKQ
jgi:hypothetical protein